MDGHTWWLFVGMTFLVSATPGPNMLLVMNHGARFGWRPAVMTMAGCMTALLAMMTLSAAGLGALLSSFPAVFNTLRYLGAAYLAYLGVQLFRMASAPLAPDAEAAVKLTSASGRTLYRQGLAVAASNPKAIVFAAAFFPQFIQSGTPALPQFGVLLATFTVIEVGWYGVYAVSGHKLSRFLQNDRVRILFNRVTGGVFVVFAAVMALGR